MILLAFALFALLIVGWLIAPARGATPKLQPIAVAETPAPRLQMSDALA